MLLKSRLKTAGVTALKKQALVLFLPLLAMILAGCGFGIEGDIYVQDLIDLPTLDEPIYAPSVFAIEYSSDDRQDELNAILEQYLRNTRNIRLEERGYTTNTVADFDIPILTGDTLEAGLMGAGNDLISIYVEYGADNTATLYAVLNTTRYSQLQQYINDEYWQDLSLEDATIVFNLINDLRVDIDAQVMSVYANSTPVPQEQHITMSRRDKIVVKFSDVLRDSLGMANDNQTYNARAFAVIALPAG